VKVSIELRFTQHTTFTVGSASFENERERRAALRLLHRCIPIGSHIFQSKSCKAGIHPDDHCYSQRGWVGLRWRPRRG
jgi:hypothetical protein